MVSASGCMVSSRGDAATHHFTIGPNERLRETDSLESGDPFLRTLVRGSAVHC